MVFYSKWNFDMGWKLNSSNDVLRFVPILKILLDTPLWIFFSVWPPWHWPCAFYGKTVLSLPLLKPLNRTKPNSEMLGKWYLTDFNGEQKFILPGGQMQIWLCSYFKNLHVKKNHKNLVLLWEHDCSVILYLRRLRDHL